MSYTFEHVGLTARKRQFVFFLLNLLILLPLRSMIAANWIHLAAIAAVLVLIYVLVARRQPETEAAVAMLPVWMFADLLILLSAVYESLLPFFDASTLSTMFEYLRRSFYGVSLGMGVVGVILLLWGRGQRPLAVTLGQLLVYWAPFLGAVNRGWITYGSGDLRMMLFVPLIWRLVCRVSELEKPAAAARNAWLTFFLGLIFWILRLGMIPALNDLAALRPDWIETLIGSGWTVALYGMLLLLMAARSYYFRKQTLGLDGLFLVLQICAGVLACVAWFSDWETIFRADWFELGLGDAAELALLLCAAIAMRRQSMGKHTLGVPNSAFLALVTVLLCSVVRLYPAGCGGTLMFFAVFIASLFLLYRARSAEEIEKNPVGGKRTANWIASMVLLALSTTMFFMESGAKEAGAYLVLAGLIVSVASLLVLSWPHPHRRRVSARAKSVILIGFAIVCMLSAMHAEGGSAVLEVLKGLV